jgi:hypothetical protein
VTARDDSGMAEAGSLPDDSRRSIPARDMMKKGAVTFLDVLGWKGIWLRRNSLDVVDLLKKLVATAKEEVRGAEPTEVLSISDTLVLLTVGGEGAVQLHGRVTARLICDSIEYGLPLRGATSFGEFFVDAPSILVGAAVDEAASWHEAADWIGATQTPAAFLSHEVAGLWKGARAPLKGAGPLNLPCVNWPETWRERGRTRKELQACFSMMGPFDPVIAMKYTNTLAFFDLMAPSEAPRQPK